MAAKFRQSDAERLVAPDGSALSEIVHNSTVQDSPVDEDKLAKDRDEIKLSRHNCLSMTVMSDLGMENYTLTTLLHY